MMHCGVHLSQKNDGGWILDRSSASPSTRFRRMATLRSSPSPSDANAELCLDQLNGESHHAAKLSHLQSILPKGEREVLKEINKFTRELYGQRNVTLEIHNLYAEKDEDVVAVAWSDAALANRLIWAAPAAC